MNITGLICKGCGAPLNENLVCEYCGTRHVLDNNEVKLEVTKEENKPNKTNNKWWLYPIGSSSNFPQVTMTDLFSYTTLINKASNVLYNICN